MNLNLIITKLFFIFFLVIMLFGASFYGYSYYEQEQLNTRIKDDYTKITRYLEHRRPPIPKIEEYVNSLNFELVSNPNEILKNGTRTISVPGFELIENDTVRYLHILTPDFRVLFKDLNHYTQGYYGFWILGFIFLLFCITFSWIIKTLQPLEKLKNEIEDFANGNLEVDCRSTKKDEIAQVANEFDKTAKKIGLLLKSRQLFLRTIMHELKTPIAKGKIVASLIDDTVQKERMSTIFDKLNYLINDFSKIEQVISQNYTLNKSPYSMGAILSNAIDFMMLDNVDDKIDVENLSAKKLHVDLELFSLAVKNLIDNALKYSSNKKVCIQEEEEKVSFSSVGEKLPKPLHEYFKPFHNDTSTKNHGMGLGLYIVHTILEMHGMHLEYHHENHVNIFSILFRSHENKKQSQSKT